MLNITKLIASLKGEQVESINGSIAITDGKVIESFVSKNGSTFLVSFPRTGSHWLRMMMELYFNRPSLVRVFYYPDITNYLTLHTHDKDLTVAHENVIYLYRDPVDTVYSQLNYYNEDVNDETRIGYWSNQYGKHLYKWLLQEKFTKKKTVITYEGMKRDLLSEFSKITDHFEEKYDKEKVLAAASVITKEEVKNKTSHDPQVVQIKAEYGGMREDFRANHSQQVWDSLITGRDQLRNLFLHL